MLKKMIESLLFKLIELLSVYSIIVDNHTKSNQIKRGNPLFYKVSSVGSNQ